MHRCLGGLHRIVLILDGRGWAREVVDLIYLDEQRKRDVVTQELETRLTMKVFDVAFAAGKKVVGTDNLMAIGNQSIYQVGPKKARTSRDQDSLSATVKSNHHTPRG